MSWSRALASVALGSVTVACSILVSTSGLSGGPDPAAVGDAEASVDGGGDGPSSDGPTETGIPSCDPNKPFVVTAFPPPIKTSSYEFAGSLSPDRLTLYFASDRGGQSEIYVTKRGSIGGDDWSSPEKLSELGQGSNIAIAADQLSIAFDTQRNGSKDLYRAHRASVTAPFDAPAPFSGVNSGVKEDLEPWPSADGKHLYFASDRGGNLALYVASQVSGDTFVGPTPINELDSTDDDEDPEVTSDELTMFFASHRPGGKGGNDIWISHRTSTTATWQAPTLVPELNSSDDDYASWISADGCALIFERVSGNGDLYFAERPP